MKRIYISTVVLSLALAVSSCGNSGQDEGAKVQEACNSLANAVNLETSFEGAQKNEFAQYAREASRQFRELGLDNPEFLKYSETAGRYAMGTYSYQDLMDLFAFCGI